MLKLLVFDLDGTLADTRRDLAESLNHALRGGGRPALPLEKVLAHVGNGAERLVSGCLAAATGRIPDAAEAAPFLSAFLDHYRDHCTAHTAAYPGLVPALDRLRRGPRGEARLMAVLTNKPQAPTEKILAALGLSGYFDLVLGGDSPYGRKPDPGGLNHILAALEVPAAAAALIGDGAQDAGAARAAGVRLIGFLGGIAPREAMLATRPDAVCETLSGLPEAVAAAEAARQPAPGRRA